VGLVLVLCVLRCGDRQVSKWVYMFRAYVWPGEVPGVPGRYTGRWTTWHANGRKEVEGGFLHGDHHGPWAAWWENGARMFTGEYDRGSPTGWWTEWNGYGTVLTTGLYRDGVPREGLCYTYPGKAFSAVYRGGRVWNGAVWQDFRGKREHALYRHGLRVGEYVGGYPWSGSFLECDEDGLFVERRYVDGEVAVEAPFEGDFVGWDSAQRAFIRVTYRQGRLVATSADGSPDGPREVGSP
jgi:hypothetical protein